MSDKTLRQDIEAVAQPLAEASGLPNRAYTDPALFVIDRDAVLGASWSAICFVTDLPHSGFAVPIDFMGLPLLVVRDRDDDIKVFHNVCRHRGMQLVHEAAPLKNVLRCPYHSWAYDHNGKLVSTPHIGGSGRGTCEGFDRTAHSLRPVRHAIWMDMVFVNLSGAAEPFEERLRPLTERWQTFTGKDGFAPLRVPASDAHMELTLNCNWKLAVENYCEAYHLPWVHRALESYSPLSEHYNIVIEKSMSGQGSLNYRPAGGPGEQLPRFKEWPEDRQGHAEYISFYPNVLLGIQADHAFALIVQPVSESCTSERLQLSYIGDGATDARFAACRENVLASWKLVFSEDIFAVEGMQKGRASPAFDGGVFTPIQDVPTHHFHSWVAARYANALK